MSLGNGVFVLVVVATFSAGALCWAAVETARTMRSWRKTSEDLRAKGVPVLDKAEVAIDAASVELLRIDGAISRFEEASVRVSAASGTLSEIVQAPADIVSGVAGRVRRAWKERKRSADAPEDAGVDRQEDVSPPFSTTETYATQPDESTEQVIATVSPEDVDRTF